MNPWKGKFKDQSDYQMAKIASNQLITKLEMEVKPYKRASKDLGK